MTLELRQKIYELLKAYVLPKVRYDNDLMNVLSSVWDVYQQKATGEDFRYKFLGDEIEKHYIMNEDWSHDKLFVEILQVYHDEGKFIIFVEQLTRMLHGDDGFNTYKDKLSTTLAKEDMYIIHERNTFRIVKRGYIPAAPEGACTIYVCESLVTNAVRFCEDNVKWPEDDNCLVLTHDYLWNDYSYYTRYRLYYVKDGEQTVVGELKIMKKGAMNTAEFLPKRFVALDEDYCSLGITPSYYCKMRSVFGNNAHVVLSQLRDTAFYEAIYKQFEDDSAYRISLLRDNESDKARREGRYYVYGRDMEDAYAFKYMYKLPYKGNDVEISFNYKYHGHAYERIIGLIGENGVGKTSLIKQILHSLVTNDNQGFAGPRPLFSSVMMISYSSFDHYQVDTQGKAPFINYEYSGLMKGKDLMYTTRDQVEILAENIKAIYRRRNNYVNIWEALVRKVISIETWNELITDANGYNVEVDVEGLLSLCESASSGESMYLYSVTAIMAKIRSDSLIIMDEPEQHLHPKAVTALMYSFYWILKKYDSYALICTHSPYVIRELVSPNVMIFRRIGNELIVKRIGIESFGADVSVLSDMVFGNLNESKRYEKFIEEVVERNKYDYDASVRELQTGPNSLSLNAKLFVRTIINKRQNEALEA